MQGHVRSRPRCSLRHVRHRGLLDPKMRPTPRLTILLTLALADDMNQWHLRPAAIDARALEEGEYCDAAKVEALRSAGFSFHFVIDAS